MKKYLPLYLYGATIILGGLFLIFSRFNTFQTIKLSMVVSLGIGAVLAFITALTRQNKQVYFSYHEMHAMAMLAFALATMLFCKTPETLVSFTAFLCIFYTFSEIIFCNWLFNLGQKTVYKIVFVRLILGLVTGIGTIVIMYTESGNVLREMEGFGLLFITIGLNVVLYEPIMKKMSAGNVQ